MTTSLKKLQIKTSLKKVEIEKQPWKKLILKTCLKKVETEKQPLKKLILKTSLKKLNVEKKWNQPEKNWKWKPAWKSWNWKPAWNFGQWKPAWKKLVIKTTLKKAKIKTSLKKLRSKPPQKYIEKSRNCKPANIFLSLNFFLKVHLCKAVSFLQKVCSQLLNARVRFKPTVVETLGRLIFWSWSRFSRTIVFFYELVNDVWFWFERDFRSYRGPLLGNIVLLDRLRWTPPPRYSSTLYPLEKSSSPWRACQEQKLLSLAILSLILV